MIQHKLLKENSTLHSFFEDAEYNPENPQLSNFGFEILINWKFMPSFIYIMVKGGEFTAVDRNWKRTYNFDIESKCLTQTFKEPRATEDTVIKTFLRDDEIKDLCILVSNIQKEYRSEIVTKTSNKNAKIGATQLNNYAKKRSEEKKSEERKAVIPQEAVKSKKGFAEMLGLNKCLGIEKNTTPLYTVLTDDCLPY